jgi:hypothetical protein
MTLPKRKQIALCRDFIDAEVELVWLRGRRTIEDLRTSEKVGRPKLIVDTRREVVLRGDLLTGEGEVASVSIADPRCLYLSWCCWHPVESD